MSKREIHFIIPSFTDVFWPRSRLAAFATLGLRGLTLARSRGVIFGRPRDTKYGRDYFLQNHRDIVRQLKAGERMTKHE